jgi:hypothetical protein
VHFKQSNLPKPTILISLLLLQTIISELLGIQTGLESLNLNSFLSSSINSASVFTLPICKHTLSLQLGDQLPSKSVVNVTFIIIS